MTPEQFTRWTRALAAAHRPPIPPRPPRSRIMRDYFGALVEVRQPGTALAQRAVELINFDRHAAAQPEAGRMFRR